VRRSTKRTIGLLTMIVLMLFMAVGLNYNFSRTDLAKKMDAKRREVEALRQQGGLEILGWDVIRKTTGWLATGATFPPELEALDGKNVNLVGFMQPLDQFHKMTEFLLLPLPIECYFCSIPPAKDVMLVTLEPGKTMDLMEDPMFLAGDIKLQRGASVKFFYTLENASIEVGDPNKKRGDRRTLEEEHAAPHQPAPELVAPMDVPELGKP